MKSMISRYTHDSVFLKTFLFTLLLGVFIFLLQFDGWAAVAHNLWTGLNS